MSGGVLVQRIGVVRRVGQQVAAGLRIAPSHLIDQVDGQLGSEAFSGPTVTASGTTLCPHATASL